jgi:hypothetical protein
MHLKARFHSQVATELNNQGLSQVQVAQFNIPYTF